MTALAQILVLGMGWEAGKFLVRIFVQAITVEDSEHDGYDRF